ncbi:hypothetical protein Tco_1164366 [Tanacetum coccineum]
MERAATTASSLEAEHDSGNINRYQSMATLNESFPQGTDLGSGPRRHLRFIQILLNKHKRHLLPHNKTYIDPTLTQKLFSNMRRASKGYTGVDIPLFPTMLVQGPILQGEGSTVPVDSPTYTNVADEAAFTSVDVVHGGAATTVSSIDAGQGSGNIPKSPTMPHDSPLLGGHTPGSDEGSMTLHELTVLCTILSNKVDSLETELKQTKQTYGAALTKLIKKAKKLEQTVKTIQARRRAKIVSSQEDQSEDQLGVLSATKVLTDAAKKNVNTYTRRRRAVSTGSEGVSTASRIFSTTEESVSTARASMPVSTASMIQQVNIIIPSSSETTKDKGKSIMQESKQPKKIKNRVQIHMSLDEKLAQKLHEEEQARFNAEQEAKFYAEQEELLATQIQADEDLAQKLLEEERENLSIEERARLLAKLIDKRKKIQAAQRYEAIRNKPQTMSQQRKTMCTYMKNMAGYKMEYFKGKNFYEFKEMFDNDYK